MFNIRSNVSDKFDRYCAFAARTRTLPAPFIIAAVPNCEGRPTKALHVPFTPETWCQNNPKFRESFPLAPASTVWLHFSRPKQTARKSRDNQNNQQEKVVATKTTRKKRSWQHVRKGRDDQNHPARKGRGNMCEKVVTTKTTRKKRS